MADNTKVGVGAAAPLTPSTASAGGFLDGKVIRIEAPARFVPFDYNGQAKDKAGNPVSRPTAQLPYSIDGEMSQYPLMLGCGSEEIWQPSDDGLTLINVSGKDASTLNVNCGLMFFLLNAIRAGFPEDRLASGDISVLEGEYFQMQEITMPDAKPDKSGKPPTKHKVPEVWLRNGPEGAAPVAPKPAAAPKAAAKLAAVAKPAQATAAPTATTKAAQPSTEAAAGITDNDLEMHMAELIQVAGGSMVKPAAVQALNKSFAAQGHPVKAIGDALKRTMMNQAWITNAGGERLGMFEFDGTNLTVE